MVGSPQRDVQSPQARGPLAAVPVWQVPPSSPGTRDVTEKRATGYRAVPGSDASHTRLGPTCTHRAWPRPWRPGLWCPPGRVQCGPPAGQHAGKPRMPPPTPQACLKGAPVHLARKPGGPRAALGSLRRGGAGRLELVPELQVSGPTESRTGLDGRGRGSQGPFNPGGRPDLWIPREGTLPGRRSQRIHQPPTWRAWTAPFTGGEPAQPSIPPSRAWTGPLARGPRGQGSGPRTHRDFWEAAVLPDPQEPPGQEVVTFAQPLILIRGGGQWSQPQPESDGEGALEPGALPPGAFIEPRWRGSQPAPGGRHGRGTGVCSHQRWHSTLPASAPHSGLGPWDPAPS